VTKLFNLLYIMHGGDTDTNAAICGALLGAVCGREAMPDNGSTLCKTAALRPDICEYDIHALNASGRWMFWRLLAN